MITKGILVRLEAKSGQEAKLQAVLLDTLRLIQSEQETPVWFAVQFGPGSFGIFDGFRNEEGRNAHMGGEIASRLRSKLADLLASPPVVEKIDVIGAKP